MSSFIFLFQSDCPTIMSFCQYTVLCTFERMPLYENGAIKMYIGLQLNIGRSKNSTASPFWGAKFQKI